VNDIDKNILTLHRQRWNGSGKKCLPAILLAALTSACSGVLPSTQLTTASTTPPAAPLATPPADYRKIIGAGVPAPMMNGAQVSELRKSIGGGQSGDWIACVKSDTKPYVGFFAVFIENEKVVDFRRAVGVDRCEAAIYSPLPPPVVQKRRRPSAVKSIQHRQRVERRSCQASAATHGAPGRGAAGGRDVDAVYARETPKAREPTKLTRRGNKLTQRCLIRTASWIAGSSPAMTRQTHTYATD